VRRFFRNRHGNAVFFFQSPMAALMASSASTEQWIFTGGERKLAHDVRVLDRKASSTVLPLTHSVAREELAMATAPKVLNLASSMTLVSGLIFHLQLHHVAALRRSDETVPTLGLPSRGCRRYEDCCSDRPLYRCMPLLLLLARFTRFPKPALFTALSEAKRSARMPNGPPSADEERP